MKALLLILAMGSNGPYIEAHKLMDSMDACRQQKHELTILRFFFDKAFNNTNNNQTMHCLDLSEGNK